MSNDFYRREDDQKWKERTDDRLAALTSGDTVQNDRLDELEQNLMALDRVIRGDVEKDTEGLLGRLHMQEVAINRLNAMLNMDSTGNPGLIKKVDALWKKEIREEKQIEIRWKFWGVVVVAIISSITALLTNVDRMISFWKVHSGSTNEAHAQRPKRNKKGPARLPKIEFDENEKLID